MDNILELLKPKNVFLKHERLGPPEDGGYVAPSIVLEQCSALLTYGVGHDIRYEEDFVKKYNKKAYLFDHTIGREQWSQNMIEYYPEGLGFEANCKEWYTHCEELDLENNIFLKIDIEAGEYDYFKKTNISKMNDKVLGLLLEIHWIDNEQYRQSAIDLLHKLEDGFILSHIHGNNWGELWNYEGHEVPKVLELTFINRKLVNSFEETTEIYPIIGLDIPNNPNKTDYPLTFINNK
jgi:hypothetical protein